MPTQIKITEVNILDHTNYEADRSSKTVYIGSHIPDVSSRLFPCYSSHNLFTEGGRKCHIGIDNKFDGIPICKREIGLFSLTLMSINEEWIKSGLDSNNLCKDCAKKALSILSNASKL
jgi:hypothetical protein